MSAVDPRVWNGVGDFVGFGLGQAPHLVRRALQLVQYVLQ